MTDDMIKEHLVRAHLAESVTLDAGTWTEVLEEVLRLRELHELYKDKTERLRCTRCGMMTWPKDADEKVKEMLADAMGTEWADVMRLSQERKIRRQLEKINPEDLKRELREYGAWDDEELADHAQNLQRILWIAAGDITERN